MTNHKHRIIQTCPTCHKQFEQRVSDHKTYCSLKCAAARFTVPRVARICATCGKTFYVRQQQFANPDFKGKYCSHKCYSKSLIIKRSKSEYHEIMRARLNKYRFGGNRQAVLDRDNHRCTICGATDNLDIHHIDGTGYKSIGSYNGCNNNMDNLVTLCHSCHTKLHHSKKQVLGV